METQTRAEQRDLSPYQSHIVFLCPYRFKHSLQGASLAHPGSPWEKYRDKSSQASETDTIWDWGACTQYQVIPTSCFQFQYIRRHGSVYLNASMHHFSEFFCTKLEIEKIRCYRVNSLLMMFFTVTLFQPLSLSLTGRQWNIFLSTVKSLPICTFWDHQKHECTNEPLSLSACMCGTWLHAE